MVIDRVESQTKYTEQNVQNASFDEEFNVSVTEGLSFDGVNLQRNISDNVNQKVQIVGSVYYIAIAPPGTLQSEDKWQVKKVDTTTGIVVTWCDGNSDFDNVATDLSLLSYS